jgi:adenylate kinase
MRIVLLGPPGVGKGTQGERLARITGAAHLATGDLVRAEIRAATALGREIQGFNDRGELVPDAVIIGLIEPYLLTNESWILDGFPRDEAQARALDLVLKQAGTGVDRVITLTAPDDVLVTRLAGRLQSAATGETYHVTFNPPPPNDPGPFTRRVDDTPEDILRRLEIYHGETEPLKRYYAARGLLTEVDASGSMDETTDAVVLALRIIPT